MLLSSPNPLDSISPSVPRFSPSDVVRITRTHFGFDASVKQRFPGFWDQNFHIADVSSGREYVLKICSSDEPRIGLLIQNEVLEYLQEADLPDIAFPQVVPPIEGSPRLVEEDGHFVRLLTYVPGITLQSAGFTPERLRSLGRVVGRLDRHFFDNSYIPSIILHEMNDERPGVTPLDVSDDWNIRNVMRVVRRDCWPHLSDEKKSVVSHYIEKYQSVVVPLIPHLRMCFIHNDAHDLNTLVLNEGEQEVCGLLDFGLIGYSYLVMDLAVSVAYTMLQNWDTGPLLLGSYVVQGFVESFGPLTDEERAAMYLLSCMRVCTSVACGEVQLEKDPDNEYLLTFQVPGFKLLKSLMNVDHEEATQVLFSAVGL